MDWSNMEAVCCLSADNSTLNEWVNVPKWFCSSWWVVLVFSSDVPETKNDEWMVTTDRRPRVFYTPPVRWSCFIDNDRWATLNFKYFAYNSLCRRDFFLKVERDAAVNVRETPPYPSCLPTGSWSNSTQRNWSNWQLTICLALVTFYSLSLFLSVFLSCCLAVFLSCCLSVLLSFCFCLTVSVFLWLIFFGCSSHSNRAWDLLESES